MCLLWRGFHAEVGKLNFLPDHVLIFTWDPVTTSETIIRAVLNGKTDIYLKRQGEADVRMPVTL